ncbi:TPA: hypothetical protein RY498_002535 [Escherichia albertii]|nr:hypothetical protein [Escherichia albertii]
MKKIKAAKSAGLATRWICTLCHRQYCGAKPCPFCRSAVNSVAAG